MKGKRGSEEGEGLNRRMDGGMEVRHSAELERERRERWIKSSSLSLCH